MPAISRSRERHSGFKDEVYGFRYTCSNLDHVVAGDRRLAELVSMCYASFNRHRGIHPLTVLTRDNYQEYVSLPDHIMDKVKSGTITITHLSDVIRFALLSQYGGLWLDSTVFVVDRIPEEIFTLEYFTVKWPMIPKKGNLVQGRWTNFLHAAQKGNVLCHFVFDFFLEYWRTNDYLINYFLIDYAIQMAYDELPQYRKLLDEVPVMNDDLYRLEKMMNSKWDPAVVEEIKTNALFSKLSWRKGGEKGHFPVRKRFTGISSISVKIMSQNSLSQRLQVFRPV